MARTESWRDFPPTIEAVVSDEDIFFGLLGGSFEVLDVQRAHEGTIFTLGAPINRSPLERAAIRALGGGVGIYQEGLAVLDPDGQPRCWYVLSEDAKAFHSACLSGEPVERGMYLLSRYDGDGPPPPKPPEGT